jgi:hypothetical protein
MPVLKLKMEGDGAWPDMVDKLTEGKVIRSEDIELAVLKGGMASGKPSIAIRINLDDDSVVFAETSLALFLSAADAFKAKYGDPRRSGS